MDARLDRFSLLAEAEALVSSIRALPTGARAADTGVRPARFCRRRPGDLRPNRAPAGLDGAISYCRKDSAAKRTPNDLCHPRRRVDYFCGSHFTRALGPLGAAPARTAHARAHHLSRRSRGAGTAQFLSARSEPVGGDSACVGVRREGTMLDLPDSRVVRN